MLFGGFVIIVLGFFLLVPVACNQIIKNCHKQINTSESSGKYFTLKAFYAILAIGLIGVIFV